VHRDTVTSEEAREQRTRVGAQVLVIPGEDPQQHALLLVRESLDQVAFVGRAKKEAARAALMKGTSHKWFVSNGLEERRSHPSGPDEGHKLEVGNPLKGALCAYVIRLSRFQSSKRQNCYSKLAQVPEQSKFICGAYLVAAEHH